MRLLMIQVPTSRLGAGERVYPLGLARLARLVPPEVERWALDMNLHPDPWPLLKERLLAIQPHVVALSFRNLDPLAGQHTSYLYALQSTAAIVRRLVPTARIFAGGPAFSLFPRRLMVEIPELDGGIRGEAEGVFSILMAHADQPAKVPGLIWRNGERLVQNPPGNRLHLDDIPPADTDLFRPANYLELNQYVAAVGIEGKRGCDLCCGYCVYPALAGGKMRLRHPRVIVDEMEAFHRDHGVALFHFTDPVLNRPVDHFEALCHEIRRRRLMLSWTGFFREDSLTPEGLALAMESGLTAVYFSGDALTTQGLKLLNKHLQKSDLLRAARITTAARMLTMCHFLVNLPQEDAQQALEARETLDRILEIHAGAGNLGAVILNTVRLYPEAPLTRRLLKTGHLNSQVDLLYPIYHNPPETSHRLHQLASRCHLAGVWSRLALVPQSETSSP